MASFNTASGKRCCNGLVDAAIDELKMIVSIPQAVSAVATLNILTLRTCLYSRFNTASGKRCCNLYQLPLTNDFLMVSIPQAVSAVATCTRRLYSFHKLWVGFNTASGKRCCNSRVWKANIYAVPKASFGKPQTVNGKFSPH